MVTSAEMSPSRRTNDAVCIFSYEYISETAKSNWSVKSIGDGARWADLTIRITNSCSMCARRRNIVNDCSVKPKGCNCLLEK